MADDKQVKQENNKGKTPKTTFADRPQDINRKGRPKKGHSLTDLLQEVLEQPHDETGKTKKQAVIDKIYQIAVVDESETMLKYLFDRIDGKPLQQVEADINGNMNISIGKEFDGI